MDNIKPRILASECLCDVRLAACGAFEARAYFRFSSPTAVPPIHWMSATFRSIVKITTESVPSVVLAARRLEALTLDEDLYQSGLLGQIRLAHFWQLLKRDALDRTVSNVFALSDFQGEAITANAWYRQGKGWCIGAGVVSATHVWATGSVFYSIKVIGGGSVG